MAKRNIQIYLDDIYESILAIEGYMLHISEHEFELNQEKQDAVIRRLEIIGEAAKQIPDDIRLAYKAIPWRQITGMRDMVIHAYFGVSIGLIWKVATSDIPILKIEIEQLRKDFT